VGAPVSLGSVIPQIRKEESRKSGILEQFHTLSETHSGQAALWREQDEPSARYHRENLFAYY
jgi:hypothetical protein